MSIHSETEYPSLTPLAVQVSWKTPPEFPECPAVVSGTALEDYASRLSFGTQFSQNGYGSSWVVERQLTADDLVVLTHLGESAVKEWAVSHVSVRSGLFYHRNESTFFSLRGALKHFCSLSGEQLDESIDDYC